MVRCTASSLTHLLVPHPHRASESLLENFVKLEQPLDFLAGVRPLFIVVGPAVANEEVDETMSLYLKLGFREWLGVFKVSYGAQLYLIKQR